jgi:superfamily I DNA/RNA helicase
VRDAQQESLTDIFRFHKNIAKLAGSFAKNGDDLEQKVTKVEQKEPIIIDVDFRNEEADKVVEVLNTLRNHRSRIGIIAPSKERLQSLFEDLSGRGVEASFFMDNRDLKHYDFTSNVPLLITSHSAKGLEFENVIVLGFDSDIKNRFRNELDELIYVSVTRANSGLYLIRNNQTIDKLRNISVEKEMASSMDDVFDF